MHTYFLLVSILNVFIVSYIGHHRMQTTCFTVRKTDVIT